MEVTRNTIITPHQERVLLDRYAHDGETTPEQVWRRVADFMGDTDAEKDQFFRVMQGFKFVPGGRQLAGAGTGNEVTFYNCYVIPVETKARRRLRDMKHEGKFDAQPSNAGDDAGSDSREAIFDTIGTMVDIMSRGGGVGLNWSVLRPSGAHLSRVNGTSSGPIGWMDVASKAVGEVEQGGSRRGAAMFMLDDWHPDVLNFINAKRDESKLTNANISVAISERFMEAVEYDEDWTFVFPETSNPCYNQEWDGDLAKWRMAHPVKEYGKIKARDMWRQITDSAWASGEPGVVFMGRYNELSTGAGKERLIAVNPCGEQGLGAYSVCNLGSMNLAAYLLQAGGIIETALGSKEPPRVTNGKWEFDWTAFRRDIHTAVRFLDNAIDKNFYFLPDNERQQMRLRRIGLGVMGLADALIALGIRYGSPEAVEWTAKVFSDMKREAIVASNVLAKEKGPAPAWDVTMLNRPYFKDVMFNVREAIRVHGMRNLFLLTQAPTGTTSILADVNSGIEPLFAKKWTRTDRTGTHEVIAPAILRYTTPGEELPDYVVTAEDINVAEHIAMQAAVQMYVDSSVSKTINAPHDQSKDDCELAYRLAYAAGLKGLAYYRDGSRQEQVLTRESVKADPVQDMATARDLAAAREEIGNLREQLDACTRRTIIKRPYSLTGETIKTHAAVGTVYVTVNHDEDGRPVEVFINTGKAGTDITTLGEALGRLISLALRHGATLGGVANQLEDVGGVSKFNVSLPAAISKVLTNLNRRDEKKEQPVDTGRHIGDIEVKLDLPKNVAPVSQPRTGQLCSNCKQFTVVREEGCFKCHACGQSAC